MITPMGSKLSKTLVVGAGGREHALAWKLGQESEVLCLPGNAGMAAEFECLAIPTTDHHSIAKAAHDRSIDLVVVGPEDPLILGLADTLRSVGIAVYGPSSDGARLEGSKAFSKALMKRAGVKTAQFRAFTDSTEAIEFAKSRFDNGFSVAVKASGNALGKGVIVADTLANAINAIEDMMVRKSFGVAGDEIVVEDRLIGREFSLLTIVGAHNFVSLPVAQDYKKVFDGDKGPNTGGVGSYSPTPWVTAQLVEEAEREMVQPILEQMKAEGINFTGTLFSGVMVVEDSPWCLEYNVRFGDPETQSVMYRLGDGFGRALLQSATNLPIEPIEVIDNHVVSIVVCGGDYPAAGTKGSPIHIDPLPEDVKLFHAGTTMADGQLVTNGGRIVTVTATANSPEVARRKAYEGAKCVQFDGARYRSDIAAS